MDISSELFREVTVGQYDNRTACIDALNGADVQLEPMVRSDLLQDNFPLVRTPKILQLVRTTLGEFGFPDGTVYGQMLLRAASREMLCPHEAPFVLASAYADQPEGERVVVVTPFFINTALEARAYAVETLQGHCTVRGFDASIHTFLPGDTTLVLKAPA